MKRPFLVAGCAAALFLSGCGRDAKNTTPPALFNDSELERAVRACLGMLEGLVSNVNLASLEELHGISAGAVDISGIECYEAARVASGGR